VKVRIFVFAVLACAACAKKNPESKSPPRLKDSVPEKSAALRNSGTPRHLEEDDNRWQIENAKQRKLDQEAVQSPAGPKAVIPMPPPNERGRRADAGAAEK
jgi:hypothetical protein